MAISSALRPALRRWNRSRPEHQNRLSSRSWSFRNSSPDVPAANLGGHRPQEALTAAGAGQLKVVRYAILPQVVPQYIAYTLYILDRNVRMATVIGLVGAGASARS